MDNALLMEQRREWFMQIVEGLVIIPDAAVQGDYENEEEGE